MSADADDHRYMAEALRLARRGLTSTDPNPRVGCVLVAAGEVVGRGWHRQAGGPHAEIFALQQAGAKARGASAYVTLEPCAHQGRTGSCAQALIDAGVKQVTAAMEDPFHRVSGGGIELLRQAGIKVNCGLMQAQAAWLNRGFISRCSRKRPWIRLKTAASLDGKTALANGASQWITGSLARADVQRWRARASAVMTGIGTVLADQPRLNVRLKTARQPLRVIVDSHWRTPPDAPILDGPGAVLIAGLESAPVPDSLSRAAECMPLPAMDGKVHLSRLLAELAARDCNEVHVEAGAVLCGSLLSQGLVDEWISYLAPKIMGEGSRGLFDMQPMTAMKALPGVTIRDLRTVGEDIRLQLLLQQEDAA